MVVELVQVFGADFDEVVVDSKKRRLIKVSFEPEQWQSLSHQSRQHVIGGHDLPNPKNFKHKRVK